MEDVTGLLKAIDDDLAVVESSTARALAKILTLSELCGPNAITTRLLDTARHDLTNVQQRRKALNLTRDTLVKQARGRPRASAADG